MPAFLGIKVIYPGLRQRPRGRTRKLSKIKAEGADPTKLPAMNFVFSFRSKAEQPVEAATTDEAAEGPSTGPLRPECAENEGMKILQSLGLSSSQAIDALEDD